MGIETAIIGSAALGYLSSKDAAGAQSDAANRATGISREQYQQNRTDLAPWRTGGATANQRLLEYLGLATPDSRGIIMPTRSQFTTPAVAGSPGTPWMWNPMGGGYLQPKAGVAWRPAQFDQAGYDAALTDYKTKLAAPAPEGFGSLLKPFTGTDLTSEPGYQFGLSEGEKGINRAAAGRGSYDSGAT